MTLSNWFFGGGASSEYRGDKGDAIGQSLRINDDKQLSRSNSEWTGNFSASGTVSVWYKFALEYQDQPDIQWIVPNIGDGGFYDRGMAHNGQTGVITVRGSLGIDTVPGVYRDPGAWYHIVLCSDGTNQKVYINGELKLTSTSTWVAGAAQIGTDVWKWSSPTSSPGALVSDVYFIDGQALDPTTFGRYNTEGVWVPVDPELDSTEVKYSDYVYSPENNGWVNGDRTPDKMFDGDTVSETNANGTTDAIVWAPPSPIAYTSSVELIHNMSNNTGNLYFNDPTESSAIATVGPQNWQTLASGSGEITEIRCRGISQKPNICAIRVDGVILIDPFIYSTNLYTSPSSDTIPVNPTSQNFNTDGNGFDQSDAFNGDNSTGAASDAGGGSWIQFRPENEITATTSVSVRCQTVQTIAVNGTDTTLSQSADSLQTVDISAQLTFPIDIETISIRGNDVNNPRLCTIIVDGVELTNGAVPNYGTNGFHLDFSDPNDVGSDRSGNGNDFTATGFNTDTVAVWSDQTYRNPAGGPVGNPISAALLAAESTTTDQTFSEGPDTGFNGSGSGSVLANSGYTVFRPTVPIENVTSIICHQYEGQGNSLNGVDLGNTTGSTGTDTQRIYDGPPITLETWGAFHRTTSPTNGGWWQLKVGINGGDPVTLVDNTGEDHDLVVDTPTNNYSTLNPLLVYSGGGGNGPSPTDDGNLTLNGSTNTDQKFGLSTFRAEGRVYVEMRQGSTQAGGSGIAIYTGDQPRQSGLYYGDPKFFQFFENGNVEQGNGTTGTTILGTYTNWAGEGNVASLALDMDRGEAWFAVNGVWQGGDPETGTSPNLTGLNADQDYAFIGMTCGSMSDDPSINYGQQPFLYTPPERFASPDPVDGTQYMQSLIGPGQGADYVNALYGAWVANTVSSTGGYWDGTQTPELMFNGSIGSPTTQTDQENGTTITFTPATPIPYTTSVRVYQEDSGNASLNGGATVTGAGSFSPSTLATGSGTITSIVFGGLYGGSIGAIEVDGQILVDSYTNGNWSSFVTTNTSFSGSQPPSNGFDGNTGTEIDAIGQGGVNTTVTFAPTTPIDIIGKAVRLHSTNTDTTVSFGGSTTATNGGWITVANTNATEISTTFPLVLTRNSQSSSTGFTAIEVGGIILKESDLTTQLRGNWSKDVYFTPAGQEPNFNSTTPNPSIDAPSANGFDGDLNTIMASGTANASIIFRPETPIEATSSLRIYINNKSQSPQLSIYLNSAQVIANKTYSPSQWEDLSGFLTFPATIENIAVKGSNLSWAGGYVAAIEVDGKILVDASILAQAQSTFSNGLWWIKDRDNSNQHQLVDSVRGGNMSLLMPNSGYADPYQSPSGDSVAWCWKSGDTVETNNNGTIPSTVSANVEDGFSIITYTGTGNSGTTIGHGLSSAPEFMIMKRTDAGGDFINYHVSLGADEYLSMTSSAAANGAALGYWNNTEPTSSVITLGDASRINAGGGSHVIYAWTSVPGYSSFGNYQGNSDSANGPYIECGFKPAWVMIKRSSTTGSWYILDTTRDTINPINNALFPNLTDPDGKDTGYSVVFSDRGFQIATTNTNFNSSGDTYIYAAFAGEIPQQMDEPATANFAAVTYTGNGSTQSIDSLGFQPDFVWIKDRDQAKSNVLFDLIRGPLQRLISNSTGEEATAAGTLVSFDPNGFTVGNNTGVNDLNGSRYVAWCWKAGGAAVTNTDGSITSQVSANVDAGFSIISYTGTGSLESVGHGLDKAPEFMISKRYDGAAAWCVYHQAKGAAFRGTLNETFAFTSTSNWGSTEPTDAVWTIGSGPNDINTSGEQVITYAWHSVPGFSSFGSYVGNSSTSGARVRTGFRPAYIMIKRADNADHWATYDSARDKSNPAILQLQADTSSGDNNLEANNALDFLEDGFQLKTVDSRLNGNETYIYAAFAEYPTPPVEEGDYIPLSTEYTDTSAILNGREHSQPVLATGPNILTSAQNTFSEGLWWIKDRQNSNQHQFVDSVRGGNLALRSPNNDEVAYTAPAGDSVAWCWNLVADRSNGFDIVTYAGDGSASVREIPHNLSSPPEMMIVKNRETTSWQVYHSGVDATNPEDWGLWLDVSNSRQPADWWGDAQPGSDSFTVQFTGGTARTNGPVGTNFVAYLWHSVPGYSAFGSYSSNGSANGPLVQLGFKPQFVLIKCSTSFTNWHIYDAARDPVNEVNKNVLLANSTQVEKNDADERLDFLSNGFKLRSIDNDNLAGNTYLYMAFAENPFSQTGVPPTAR